MINYPDKPIAPDVEGTDFEGQGDGQPSEINPGEVGNNTEVDLDTRKIQNYPNQNPNEFDDQQPFE